MIKVGATVVTLALLVTVALSYDPTSKSMYRICELVAGSAHRQTGDSAAYLADIAVCERKY